MDKIGLEGVAAELKENGYAEESVEKYLQLFKEITNDVAGVRSCKEKLEGFLPAEAADSLERIITSVESAKEAEFRMFFDPTLVRGMSYYTGTIFEISMDEFGGSVGGGGRYDKMIGKFTGHIQAAASAGRISLRVARSAAAPQQSAAQRLSGAGPSRLKSRPAKTVRTAQTVALTAITAPIHAALTLWATA